MIAEINKMITEIMKRETSEIKKSLESLRGITVIYVKNHCNQPREV